MKALLWGLLVAATVAAVVWAVGRATDEPRAEARRPSSAGTRHASSPSDEPAKVANRATSEPSAASPSNDGVAARPPAGVRQVEAAKPAPTTPPNTPSATEPTQALQPPPAIRQMQAAFGQWVGSPENRDARAKTRPLDCRPPVCMLGVVYNSQRDGAFFSRAETFLQEETELGHLISFPHRFSETESRIWYYWNPHKKGTAEHHAFNLGAIDRIKGDMKDLPEFYPVPRPGY